MKIIYKTSTHKIEIPSGASVGLSADKKERMWRDSELIRTDLLSLLTDYPKKLKLVAYRKSLRDYPASADFTTAKRPQE